MSEKFVVHKFDIKHNREHGDHPANLDLHFTDVDGKQITVSLVGSLFDTRNDEYVSVGEAFTEVIVAALGYHIDYSVE